MEILNTCARSVLKVHAPIQVQFELQNFILAAACTFSTLRVVNGVKTAIKLSFSFFHSIVLGKFIRCLRRQKTPPPPRLILFFGELNCSFLDSYTAYPQKLRSCPAACASAPHAPRTMHAGYKNSACTSNTFHTARARVPDTVAYACAHACPVPIAT